MKKSGEEMEELLRVGRIINVHGIKGEVKILPLTDDINRFYSLKSVFAENKKSIIPLTIANIRMHKKAVLITFEEITTRNQAEELKGLYLNIKREDAIELSEDQYFITDLIGIEVQSLDGKKIGMIKDVLQTTSTDIYVIKTQSKEILVPARKEIFKEIDVNAKKAKADIPEDLMNL